MYLHETLGYIKCFTFILTFSLLAVAPTPAQQQPAGQQQRPTRVKTLIRLPPPESFPPIRYVQLYPGP